jgi:hypothetical protein
MRMRDWVELDLLQQPEKKKKRDVFFFQVKQGNR